jgi:hypothetical protein
VLPAGPQPRGLHCPRCRQDLSGIPGSSPDADPTELLTCPECGKPTTIMAALDTRPDDRGWSYVVLWALSVVMGLLLLSCVVGVVVFAVWTGVSSRP